MLSKICPLLPELTLHQPVNKEFINPTKIMKAQAELTYRFVENHSVFFKNKQRSEKRTTKLH